VPLFLIKAELGGIYRKQSNELIKWDEPAAKDYVCLHHTHWREVQQYCKLPPGAKEEVN